MKHGFQCLARVITCRSIRYKRKKNVHAAGMVENWAKLEHNYYCRAKFLEEIPSLAVTITVKIVFFNVLMPILTAIFYNVLESLMVVKLGCKLIILKPIVNNDYAYMHKHIPFNCVI